MSLFDRRILLVTGKGGVGKSTVSAALGLEAAAQGKRTLIVEVSGCKRMEEIFNIRDESYEPRVVGPRLSVLSITPEEAIQDYVVQVIRFKKLYKLAFQNRVMGPFIEAVPGLHDAIQLGKVFDLERESGTFGGKTWDLIIVDAPATGHGLTMLAAPRSMMELTRAGPLYDGVKRVHDVIDDPSVTGIVLVSIPEDMPINETLELYHRLGSTRAQVRLAVLNELFPSPAAAPADWEAWRQGRAAAPHSPEGEAQDLGDRWFSRVQRQDRCRARLRQLPVPQADLPFRFHRGLSTAELGEMGRALALAVP